MKIAILAWGSLVWNKRGLKTTGAFEPNGPKLPIEFCRVSGDGRLTLVIDETHGKLCTTYSARSVFESLDDALVNLWIRESRAGATVPTNIRIHSAIAFVDLVTGITSPRAMRRLDVANAITAWAKDFSFDAVIWTALGIKFKPVVGEPFSVSSAIKYLAGLNTESQSKAFEYIRKAPLTIQTPLRTEFELRWPLG